MNGKTLYPPYEFCPKNCEQFSPITTNVSVNASGGGACIQEFTIHCKHEEACEGVYKNVLKNVANNWR